MLSKQMKNQKPKQRSSYRDTTDCNPKEQSTPVRSFSNVRVVQSNLLYVIGLKPQICSQSTLKSSKYFGKFGNITKIVINKKGSTNKKYYRDVSYAAHITYDDEVSASLAVISLFEFKYQEFLMRSCFGYTKYCENFFYGNQCHKSDCVYLHENQEQQEIIAGDACDKELQRQNFEKQLKFALKIVFENRKQVIQTFRQEKQSSQFPQIYDAMKALITYGYMTEQEYQKQWQYQDNLKCYTQSTQTSPIKQQQSDLDKHQQQNQQKEQDKILFKQKQKNILRIKHKQVQIVRSKKQDSKVIVDSSMQIQQMINKCILRVLRSKNRHVKSKFQFVEQGNKYNQQFRDMFQKELLHRA